MPILTSTLLLESLKGTKSSLLNKATTSASVIGDNWNQNWDNEPVVPVKKSQTKVQSGVRKVKKLNSKMATQGFLQGEVTQQETPVQKKVMKVAETVPKSFKNEEIRSNVEFKPEEVVRDHLVTGNVKETVKEDDQGLLEIISRRKGMYPNRQKRSVLYVQVALD